MEAILKEYHAQLLAANKENPATAGDDESSSIQGGVQGVVQNRTKKRMKTREKIEKLVADGAKNYPAYLKLVHTGDSDFSDDETIERQIRNKKEIIKKDADSTKSHIDKEEIIDLGDPIGDTTDYSSLGAASPGEEKKDATKEQRLGKAEEEKEPEQQKQQGKETMYEEVGSPEYENALNSSTEPVDPEERARMEEEWKSDLAKLEDEIQTLRQVLSCKVREAGELKKKLGITPMVEFKQDIRQGFQNIKDSDAYKKTASTFSTAGEKVSASPAYKVTNEKLSQAGEAIHGSAAYQKTNSALKSVGNKTAGAFSTAGAFASKKLGDMRNSNAFKSFEEKLGGAYSNVKTRVRGSKSENNFEDALRASSLTEEQNGGGSASYPASPMTADEKVPL